MKAIEVTIKAVFEVPDDWSIVKNKDALVVGEKLNTFSMDFLEEHKKEGLFQSGDDTFFNNWIDRMETEICQIEELE